MRIPGAIYKGKSGREYLAIYNTNNHDIYTQPPPGLENALYLANVTYLKGGREGKVDIYSLPDSSPDISKFLTQEKSISLDERRGNKGVFINEKSKRRGKYTRFLRLDDIKETKIKYDIQEQIVGSTPTHIQKEISFLVEGDIEDFCENKTAKNPVGSSIELVDKIIPTTELKRIEYEWILQGGKQWFDPECILTANLDFAKGCISGWVPGKNASFDGKFFRNYWSDRFDECEYCYSKDKHGCFAKTIYKLDKKRLLDELRGACRLDLRYQTPLGKPVDILRLGKRVEPWTPFTQDEFVSTLEACIETGTKCVIPTKYLPFDNEKAKLLKKTKSALLYSIGFDNLERGAVARKATNAWRIEQAIKYREAGVNSSLYLLIIGHKPIGKREKNLLDIAKNHNLTVQLLPARFLGKDICLKMTGQPWDYLKGKPNQTELQLANEPERRSYIPLRKNKALVLYRIHPDWRKLIGDNTKKIRMCHYNNEITLCGGCFLNKGKIVRTKPVILEKIERKPRRNSRKKSYEDDDQEFLHF